MIYEAVIGLEVHVQINTSTKLFSRSPYIYGKAPNTLTDPITIALPGALPVINKLAVLKCIKLGLILGCSISKISQWDRKNYFYPDCSKNYQISQYLEPLCKSGKLSISFSKNEQSKYRIVRIKQIHLEEDVGKLTHFPNVSLVDYNRSGVPLAEIITEPDLSSADEVSTFIIELRNNIINAGISNCDMEKGQLRCDANISVRTPNSKRLGPKIEIKNMNSISCIHDAISYEIKRQIHANKNSENIIHETRRWDPIRKGTFPMRIKEQNYDYRYINEPDIIPFIISKKIILNLRKELPELILDKQTRYYNIYDIPLNIASIICLNSNLSYYFDNALYSSIYVRVPPKEISKWVVNELLRDLYKINTNRINSFYLVELIYLINKSTISNNIAKNVWLNMYKRSFAPSLIVKLQYIKEIQSYKKLKFLINKSINLNNNIIYKYKSGNKKAFNALIGSIINYTSGKADPKIVRKFLLLRLNH